MKHIKSKKLKKLEAELQDLQQWLKLGLVPKKDIDKHKEEMHALEQKVKEENDRLLFLKESGEGEEYVVPKNPAARAGGYNEMPTIPDIDMGETIGGGSGSETGFEMGTDAIEIDQTVEERDEAEEATEHDEEEEEDESYFSDRNRWRRGGIVDPDANDW